MDTNERRIKMKTQIMQSRKPSLGKKIGWAVLLLLAAAAVLFSSGYLTLNPEDFNFTQQKAVYMAHHTILMVHIVASMLAILIGPFQFLPGIRKGRLLKFHRWLGRIYLLGILFGGLGGLYMAQFAYGGTISELGFGALASLWLYSGYMAYKHIRNRDIEQHRQWMIRNYALTFAGAMLRVWLPLTGGTGIDFVTRYMIIAWFCWVPNLLVAEWIIRRSRRSQRGSKAVDLPGTAVSGPKIAQTDF
jgi:uncharacterized membrane protein